MLLDEVLNGKSKSVHPIIKECSEFLEESEGNPVLKNFSSDFNDLHKLKLRKRNKKDKFTKTFNETFKEVPNLRQRSITVNGESTFLTESGKFEPYYVFPINGYKYLYSVEVTNSKQDYKDAFDSILEMFHNENIMKEVLKYTYISNKLVEGIEHGSEIIIYNIPYCYILKESLIEDYQDFLSLL